MSEIQKDQTAEQLQALQKKLEKHKNTSSKLLIFDANLIKSEVLQQLEVKSQKNSFHTGQKPYLQNREAQIVVNLQKCSFFVLPCIEYTVEREKLAAMIGKYDTKYSEELLNETLEVGKKIVILDKYEIELDSVNLQREDFFILKYSSSEQIPEPGQVVEEPFRELVKNYQEVFKVDSVFLEHIFLNSLKDIETSERLLSIINSHKEVQEQEESKQQQMLDKLNLKDYVGEKILHLPVFKKETGFYNYSQYQVLNLETQKLSEPQNIEKPNYLK